MPPTVESEIEYLKMIRDQKRHEEERFNYYLIILINNRNSRMQRDALEKNFPPFATKTRAEHRVINHIILCRLITIFQMMRLGYHCLRPTVNQLHLNPKSQELICVISENLKLKK